MVWVGMAVSSPIAGWVSNRIGLRQLPTLVLLFFGLLASSVMIFAPPQSVFWMCFWLFFMGVCSAGQPVTFGMIHDLNPEKTLATSIALNNMLLIASCSILPPIVGMILSQGADGNAGGALTTSFATFQHAMLLVPIIVFLGMLVCYFFIDETHCKKVNT